MHGLRCLMVIGALAVTGGAVVARAVAARAPPDGTGSTNR
jgi:hypothetical protein